MPNLSAIGSIYKKYWPLSSMPIHSNVALPFSSSVVVNRLEAGTFFSLVHPYLISLLSNPTPISLIVTFTINLSLLILRILGYSIFCFYLPS